MNPGMLMPFMLMSTARRSRRRRLAESMMPAMVPMPPLGRVAVSAIVADQQVRREERQNVAAAQAQEQLALELIPDADSRISTDQLSQMPRLSAVVKGNPAVRGRLIRDPDDQGDLRENFQKQILDSLNLIADAIMVNLKADPPKQPG
jgi:hypothetical protein